MGRVKQKKYTSVFQSLLLLFFAYAIAFILYFAIHESGHALVGLAKGYTIERFVVHPFFTSYVLLKPPTVTLEGALAGTVMALSVSFVLWILLWNRRSISSLPFQMIIPITLVMQGIEATVGMTNPTSDMSWVLYFTGLPAILFYVFGFILLGLGVFIFLSLFPLLGLVPEDKKSLFVIPAGISLYSGLVVLFAYFFEPVSHEQALNVPLGYAITRAYTYLIIGVLLGVVLTVVYVTLYRRYVRRLPRTLQTEKVTLAWRDIRIPGVLAAVFVVLLLLFFN